jgi:hypothetical protein
MDGASGTTSSAQAHISVTVQPRIVVSSKMEPTTNQPGLEIVKTTTLANGVQVIVYVPSAK